MRPSAQRLSRCATTRTAAMLQRVTPNRTTAASTVCAARAPLVTADPTTYTSVLLCARRACATGSAAPSFPGHHSADNTTKAAAAAISQLRAQRTRLVSAYMDLLCDRRAQYRDHVIAEALGPTQRAMQDLLRGACVPVGASSGSGGSEVPQSGSPSEAPAPLSITTATLRHMKEAWMRGAPPTPEARVARFAALREFYATVLLSGVPAADSDVRLLLKEMQETDLMEPDASFYEAMMLGVWTLAEVREAATASSSAASPSAAAAAPPQIVAGETRQLRRGVVGDLAGHYMGHALAQSVPRDAAGRPDAAHVPVRAETWECFFATLASAQPAPKLVDLWWQRFLRWLDECGAPVRTDDADTDPLVDVIGLMESAASPAATKETAARKGAAVPYRAAHAVLAWCAQSRDMERALNYFKAVNQRGVVLLPDTCPDAVLPPHRAEEMAHAGSLTAACTDVHVQRLQLALLVKLMASTKSVKMDGGLRALVVRDVQRQIQPDVLYSAPWGVLNDLMAGLSVPSAMQLLRRCSSAFSAAAHGASTVATSAATTESDRAVPFFVWAALLRRCCREHLQDEAESLFLFLRKKFSLTVSEKRELVEIMVRMYTTMQPADFPSAVDVFLQHVLRAPDGEPSVKPDAVLYELLIRSADSRNAAMMVFLEACASGVSLTEELFEALMGSTQHSTVASLTRKLPHDYAASSFDAQLKIPADADAHLRREEALRARGKPLYSSTGDAG